MALNTFECNYLTPLHFKGLNCTETNSHPTYARNVIVYHTYLLVINIGSSSTNVSDKHVPARITC